MRRLVALLALLAPVGSLAEQGPAVLLELFTSQGCYSCPPAERLLAERFVGREDVLALEMHVDYWDDLVYWGSSWEDPYSSPAFTARQVAYARTTGRGPFTPQAVVQGAYSASGANRGAIESAIEEVKALDLARGLSVRFVRDGGTWYAEVDGAPEGSLVHSVVYKARVVTEVTGGENKGKTLENNNVVTDLTAHHFAGSGERVLIGPVGEGEGCGVVVQRPPQGVVLGAWACPAS